VSLLQRLEPLRLLDVHPLYFAFQRFSVAEAVLPAQILRRPAPLVLLQDPDDLLDAVLIPMHVLHRS
jgi:hypothetical protein